MYNTHFLSFTHLYIKKIWYYGISCCLKNKTIKYTSECIIVWFSVDPSTATYLLQASADRKRLRCCYSAAVRPQRALISTYYVYVHRIVRARDNHRQASVTPCTHIKCRYLPTFNVDTT